MNPVVGRFPFIRCTGAALALFAAVLLPGRLHAQCTLTSTPVQFEPNPPGAVRPIYGAPLGQLSAGFSNSLSLYRNGAGAPRVLMIETFGYSTLDITNALGPTALRYDDLRYDPADSQGNPVPANGDGQSYIQTQGVSADGQRVVFSVNGPAEPTWHTLVGRPSGDGFGVWGDFGESRASGTVIQQFGSRYIAYATYFSGPAIAADVTTLPTVNSSFRSLNLSSETTALPAGYSPLLTGNYLVYMTSSGVEVVDVSNPGPSGRIASSFRTILITGVPGDAAPARIPANFTAAVDPVDSTKLWVLVELAPRTGENSPSYGLVSITKDGSGNLLAPVSAGPIFRIPALTGETWISAGGSASLVVSNYQLFALMWARRMLPSQQFVLYTTTASVWASPQATPVSAPNFNLAATSAKAVAGAGTSIYQFLPTGAAAFVVPLACQALDAPAVSVLSVTNGGVSVLDGGSAFFGDTLTVTPTVLPSPAIRPLSDWRFDFDFHAGAASEDAGTLPRIRNLDNAQFGSPAAPPPSATFVGPCDPRGGGVPATGAGCWASVLSNAASGGPDFTGAEPAGTQKALKIALEGTNQYGIQNTGLFTVNWKVPGARLASTQVFAGLTLASASDGRPTGYKWYFGDAPTSLARAAACDNLPTCLPTLGTRGTHYYWLTASYANGYATPDYNGTTNVGQAYTVVDFSPVFAVNGSTSGPVSVLTGANLTISNSSMHSPSISGTYSYSLCQIPSGQPTCSSAFVSLTGMTDPPTSGAPPTYAAIAAPLSAGNFLLRIRVDFTGGPGYWPDPSGVAGFPITVTAPTPKLHIYVNGQDPCPPGPFCIEDSVRAKAGDTLTAYSYVNGNPDPGSVTLAWNFPGAAPASGNGNGVTFSYGAAGTYDLAVTRNGILYTFPGAAVIAPKPLPPTATVTATPNPATFVDNVQLACAASGGTGSYTYTWKTSDGATGSGTPFFHRFGATGSYTATCTATDTGTSLAGDSPPATITVGLPPGTGGPYALFTLAPCRVLDTRAAAGPHGGPAIQPAGTADRTFNATSAGCAIPADAKAISVNVTATNVTASGNFSIYRGDGARNGTSTGSLVAGRTRANNAIVQLALDGSGTIKVQNASGGTFDLIVDVTGFFR